METLDLDVSGPATARRFVREAGGWRAVARPPLNKPSEY